MQASGKTPLDDEKLTREGTLTQKLKTIMATLEGLSFQEVEIMLANVQASARQDTMLVLVKPDNIEFRDLKPSRQG